MRLDLHVHTTASDGAWSPEQVVEGALGRLDALAIADHDTVAGLAAALAAVEGEALEIIPAVEVSSTWRGRDIHVLGYFVDPGAPSLQAHAERAVRLREDRLVGMVARLRDQGVDVEMDWVLEAAGPDRSALGRPHLARALVRGGHAASVPDAFNRWIGDEHPAFIPTELASPMEAVELIGDAGGIAVWAHPPEDTVDALLPSLVDAGLRGLEVFRPRSPQDLVRRLQGVAKRHGLLVTGGSDWHTPDAGPSLGDFYVTSDEVGPFLDAGGL